MADINVTNRVVLEITKKLTPRLLAIILVATLIALTLVISLTLYRGGSVNLKSMTFDVPDSQYQTISSLEQSLEKCNNETADIKQQLNVHNEHPTSEALLQCKNISSQSIPLENLTQYIGKSKSPDETISKIIKLSAIKTDFTKLKQNYFFKLFILERLIPQYGKSISTLYDDENRRDTYKLLQEISLELGFYNGAITGSQIPTKNAVTEFQLAYNKKLEADADMNETSIDAVVLQPLGHVGYRTLEVFRSWYRNSAV